MSDIRPKGNTHRGYTVLSALEKHQLALKRFISRFLHNTQNIEDVAQEAFLRAYKAERNTDIQQAKSILFRIAKNVAISQLRLKSRQITDYIGDQTSSDVLASEWTLFNIELMGSKSQVTPK